MIFRRGVFSLISIFLSYVTLDPPGRKSRILISIRTKCEIINSYLSMHLPVRISRLNSQDRVSRSSVLQVLTAEQSRHAAQDASRNPPQFTSARALAFRGNFNANKKVFEVEFYFLGKFVVSFNECYVSCLDCAKFYFSRSFDLFKKRKCEENGKGGR